MKLSQAELQKTLQQALLDKMQELSERIYAAGWLSGLEYILWKSIHKIDKQDESLKEHFIQLANLHNGADGWFVYDDEPRFVSRGEWYLIFESYEKRNNDKMRKSDLRWKR